MTSLTYLDYNATAPLRIVARDEMLAAGEEFGNPSSLHRAGKRARIVLEKARARIAEVLDVAPTQLIFVSGGSEANNLALQCLQGAVTTTLVTRTEHDSILKVPNVQILEVFPSGLVDMGALEKKLQGLSGTALISVMLANNETGVIQPLADIIALARRYGAFVHTDAVQAVGRMPLSVGELGADLISISSHKMGGPAGIGLLVVGKNLKPQPLIVGGGQEKGRRAGTENVAAAAGFAAALTEASGEDTNLLKKWRDQLETHIKKVAPQVRFYGAESPRLPNTSCFGIKGLQNQMQVMALDLEGFCIGAGSACSSQKILPSHVLLAMGAEEEEAKCAIRVSLGWKTQMEDIDRFCAAWTHLYQVNQMKNFSPSYEKAMGNG